MITILFMEILFLAINLMTLSSRYKCVTKRSGMRILSSCLPRLPYITVLQCPRLILFTGLYSHVLIYVY